MISFQIYPITASLDSEQFQIAIHNPMISHYPSLVNS